MTRKIFNEQDLKNKVKSLRTLVKEASGYSPANNWLKRTFGTNAARAEAEKEREMQVAQTPQSNAPATDPVPATALSTVDQSSNTSPTSSSQPAMPKPTNPVKKPNSKFDVNVNIAQQELRNAGLLTDKDIDGILGPKTLNAISANPEVITNKEWLKTLNIPGTVEETFLEKLKKLSGI